MRPTKVLILGGSSEASALARLLAGDMRFDAMLSLAGRTREPAPAPIPVRTGGFGGAEGLVRHFHENRIEALIDATHPFALRMKRNAVDAARLAGIPLLAVRRPPWRPASGDDWTEAAGLEDAAQMLGREPRRVFLTVGRKELASFAAARQHFYLVRSVDPPPPDALPPNSHVIAARGPFAEAGELRLLREYRIEIVVTKNSGGTATQAKLAAARALRIPVLMVRRPQLPDAPSVETAEQAMTWLSERHAGTSARRGV